MQLLRGKYGNLNYKDGLWFSPDPVPCNSVYVLKGICGLLLGNSIATVTIAVTGRFMVTFALNTMMQISSEILPTQLRYRVGRQVEEKVL